MIFLLPHTRIEIPEPFICFEDKGDIELAIQTGENAADIENLEEKTEGLEEKTEGLEQAVRWNDEALDRAFERIWAMEDRINILEVELSDLKKPPEEETEKTEKTEEEKTETVLDIGETEKTEEEEKPKKKGLGVWGLW